MFFNFAYKGKPLKNAPKCFMTTKKDGSMRFRWNETNDLRNSTLKQILVDNNWQNKRFCPVELIHSQIVYDVKSADDTKNLQGDGIITTNKDIIPTITIADCVPIYFYNPSSGVFGIVHSGWKGTGIIGKALEKASLDYNSPLSDFYIVIGPHIHDCCYIVNEERAKYFTDNFTSECISPLEENGKCYCGGKGLPVTWNNGNGKLFRLSLLKANLSVLKKAGVDENKINVIDECTCCNDIFGSNRRETAFNGKPDSFTVQAAFINW